MTKAKKRYTAVAALVAALAVGTVSIGAVRVGSKKPGEEAPVDSRVLVETAKPLQGSIVIQGEYIGTVDPNREVTVYPKASGEVLSVNYDVGDYVEAGAVLCVLDSTALELSIAQTRAAVNSAQAKANHSLQVAENDLATQQFNVENGHDASLNNAESATDRAESAVTAAENGVKNAQTVLKNAQTGLKNAEISNNAANEALKSARRKLREHRDKNEYAFDAALQSPSQPNYEETERQLRDGVKQAELSAESAALAVETAKAAVETAKMGVETAKNGLNDAKRELARAQESEMTADVMTREQQVSAEQRIEQARLNTNFENELIGIEKLQNDLKNYTVVSAISGFVEKRSIDPNDMASPQAPVFVISNKDSMIINFNVSEATLSYIKLGDMVTVEKNGVTCNGSITEIPSAVDPQSGLYTIKASVSNPPEVLHNGSTVKVFADNEKSKSNIMLPIDTVYYQNGKPYVYVAENGAAKVRFVETGISDDKNIEITSGITASDMVISTWNANLTDGVEIKLSVDEPMPKASSENGEAASKPEPPDSSSGEAAN